MIEPTVGRLVHYRPAYAHTAPLAALVVGVHDARSVNLTVFNDDGSISPALEVTLLQDDDTPPHDRPYAEWMPFQKGQAQKTDAATSDLQPRVKALEEVVGTGGAIHILFSQLQADIDQRISQVEASLAAAAAAAAAQPPQTVTAGAADAAPPAPAEASTAEPQKGPQP